MTLKNNLQRLSKGFTVGGVQVLTRLSINSLRQHTRTHFTISPREFTDKKVKKDTTTTSGARDKVRCNLSPITKTYLQWVCWGHAKLYLLKVKAMDYLV